MDRVCAHCGVDIAHKRSNAVYCSRACKNAACHVRLRQGSEAERERNRRRYAKEAEKRRAAARRYYAENAERYRAYAREWRANNPERRAEQHANRRARKYSNAGFIGLPDDEWQRLVKRYGGCCAYCGTRSDALHRDHVVPLSRGGRHAPANILPACQSCNSSKGALFLSEWRLLRGGETNSNS